MESRGLALVEDGFGSPSKAEGDTLVLEEGMVVSKDVYERLLPHQRVGLRWLWSLHVAGAAQTKKKKTDWKGTETEDGNMPKWCWQPMNKSEGAGEEKPEAKERK
eukprot:jgi/Pico_ML_1/54914/g53.t1